jgi:hypothetical protein
VGKLAGVRWPPDLAKQFDDKKSGFAPPFATLIGNGGTQFGAHALPSLPLRKIGKAKKR